MGSSVTGLLMNEPVNVRLLCQSAEINEWESQAGALRLLGFCRFSSESFQ